MLGPAAFEAICLPSAGKWQNRSSAAADRLNSFPPLCPAPRALVAGGGGSLGWIQGMGRGRRTSRVCSKRTNLGFECERSGERYQEEVGPEK